MSEESQAEGVHEAATTTDALPIEETDSTSEFHSLSPNYVTFERRTSYVGGLVLSGIIVAVTSPALVFAWQRPWLAALILLGWVALFTLLMLSAHFWPPIHYRHLSWRLNQHGLEIHRGVWWRHRIAIPIARVQHVDVSQGPIQRMFDLGKLTIHTAGTKNASVELDGLDHARALALRDQLIEQKESLDVT